MTVNIPSEGDDDYVPPKTPLDYISRDQLQDMWGAGFTVIRRNTFGNDVYELADKVKRPGMARQWSDLVVNHKTGRPEIESFINAGWVRVSCEDYPGLFAPFGYQGFVEIGKLGLIECPQHRVEKAKQAQVDAAHKLVDDWHKQYVDQFQGSVTVGTQTELGKLDTVQATKIGATKTIEDTTKIPRDMAPYISEIFYERDRLQQIAQNAIDDNIRDEEVGAIQDEYYAKMQLCPDAPKWPTLNAAILPVAIRNIRKRIMEA